MGYLPHTPDDRRAMLEAIGVPSVADLFDEVPAAVRFQGALDVPPALTEAEILQHCGALAALNRHVESRPCFAGGGAYRHFIPSVVDAVISRAEFATAYTPYQPEASQGTLQAIFEFQSMICDLTGLDVANASLYDGASATAEAAHLCAAATGRTRILVSRALHPEYREVLNTYAPPGAGLTVQEIPLADGATDATALDGMLDGEVAAVVVQDPNFFGIVEGAPALAERVHAAGALCVAVGNDLTAMGLLRRPGQWGADVAVGEAAATGLPLSLGGPFVGYMAVREAFTKRLPGRIVGQTSDQEGRRGFCLTLQTREQHIRREKATSNICTNQSLCALAVTVYLAALGPQGLREVAEACARRARHARRAFAAAAPLRPRFDRPCYHEFVMRCDVEPAAVNAALAEAGMLGGLTLGRWYPELADSILFCATEVLSRADVDAAARVLAGLRPSVGAAGPAGRKAVSNRPAGDEVEVQVGVSHRRAGTS